MVSRAVQEVLHYPRLDTVIMVEEAIKKQRIPDKGRTA